MVASGTSSSPSKAQNFFEASYDRLQVGQADPGAVPRAAGSGMRTKYTASDGQNCKPASYSRWQAGQTRAAPAVPPRPAGDGDGGDRDGSGAGTAARRDRRWGQTMPITRAAERAMTVVKSAASSGCMRLDGNPSKPARIGEAGCAPGPPSAAAALLLFVAAGFVHGR